jgi:hypothetical protein
MEHHRQLNPTHNKKGKKMQKQHKRGNRRSEFDSSTKSARTFDKRNCIKRPDPTAGDEDERIYEGAVFLIPFEQTEEDHAILDDYYDLLEARRMDAEYDAWYAELQERQS